MAASLSNLTPVLIWSAATLAGGCAGFYTSQPLVSGEHGATGECALTGVWHLPDSPLEARVETDFSLVLASLAWDEETKAFSHVSVPGWIIPRRSPAFTDRGFISLQQRSDAGALLERYALSEYRIDGDQLLIWLPDQRALAQAIANGDLQGDIHPGGKLEDPVVIRSSAADLFNFLEDHANTLATHYDAGPGGRLFDYTSPLVLKRSGTWVALARLKPWAARPLVGRFLGRNRVRRSRP